MNTSSYICDPVKPCDSDSGLFTDELGAFTALFNIESAWRRWHPRVKLNDKSHNQPFKLEKGIVAVGSYNVGPTGEAIQMVFPGAPADRLTCPISICDEPFPSVVIFPAPPNATVTFTPSSVQAGSVGSQLLEPGACYRVTTKNGSAVVSVVLRCLTANYSNPPIRLFLLQYISGNENFQALAPVVFTKVKCPC